MNDSWKLAASRLFRAIQASYALAGFQPVIAFSCISMMLLFVFLAEEVIEGDTARMDLAILLAFRVAGDPAQPKGPAWLVQSSIDISALGGTSVTLLLTVFAAGLLIVTRNWRQLSVLLAVICGAALLSSLLKTLFHRDRPAAAMHLVDVWSASFPSGHAMTSATVYLTIAAMAAMTQSSRPIRIYFLSGAVIVTILIGLTRVYLGVHWPSDVVGGWFAGSAWAMLFWVFSGTGTTSQVANKLS